MKKLLLIALITASANTSAAGVCVDQIVYDPRTGQTYNAQICNDTPFGEVKPDPNAYPFQDQKVITCEYMDVYGQWQKVCR